MNRKVLILNSCVNGGGAGRSLENYLKFKDEDIDIHMIVPELGVMGEVFSKDAALHVMPQFVERIHRSRYNLPRWLDHSWVHILLNAFDLGVAMKKITALGKRIKPDVIYCNHMLANPIGAYVGWKLDCPVVFHARNIHVAWFGRMFYNFLAKRSFVKKIICNSKASAALFLESVPEKVVIIPNFLDLTKYDPAQLRGTLRSEHHIPSTAFVYGYSGRLLPKKGVDVLLNAFHEVASANPDVYLVIMGDNDGGVHIDWKGRFQQQVRDWNLSERVIFTGFQKDVRPYLIDFDVLVLPSVEPESFGRVLIEAMALKVPSIATSLGGTTEVIVDGKTGFLIPPSDVSILSKKLKSFLDQPGLKKDFSDAGYERVHSNFSAQTLSKKISSVLSTVN